MVSDLTDGRLIAAKTQNLEVPSTKTKEDLLPLENNGNTLSVSVVIPELKGAEEVLCSVQADIYVWEEGGYLKSLKDITLASDSAPNDGFYKLRLR